MHGHVFVIHKLLFLGLNQAVCEKNHEKLNSDKFGLLADNIPLTNLYTTANLITREFDGL